MKTSDKPDDIRSQSQGNKSNQSPAHDKSRTDYPDAITFITNDHREINSLFVQYQELVQEEAQSKELTTLAQKICNALTIHAQIEEELLYPELRKSFSSDELINEASVEHASVKSLVDQIRSANRRDALYDAKVKVLNEYVEHHVKEEENEIFPTAVKLKLDLSRIGKSLWLRSNELMSETNPNDKSPNSRSSKTQRGEE